MNRMFRVFVVTVLALAISMSFCSALAKRDNKPPKPTKPAVESIALTLVNRAGTLLTPGTDGSYAVVTGQKYTIKAEVTPSTAKPWLRWRSSKHSIANVDGRGNVFCAKSGTATITVSDKTGKIKQTIVLNAHANMATFDVSTDKAIKQIYLKGRNIMIDVVLENTGTEPLEEAPGLKFSLKLAGETNFTDLGVKSGHIRREIAAGAFGTATYKVSKADPRTICLIGATALCEVPA